MASSREWSSVYCLALSAVIRQIVQSGELSQREIGRRAGMSAGVVKRCQINCGRLGAWRVHYLIEAMGFYPSMVYYEAGKRLELAGMPSPAKKTSPPFRTWLAQCYEIGLCEEVEARRQLAVLRRLRKTAEPVPTIGKTRGRAAPVKAKRAKGAR
jgi:hypothetical protein